MKLFFTLIATAISLTANEFNPPEIKGNIILNILAGAKNGAAYVEIYNPNTELVVLESVKIEETNSLDSIELHDHIKKVDENNNEYMEMIEVPEFEIQPGSTLRLSKGSKHIMLMGIKQNICSFKLLNFIFNFRNSKGEKFFINKKASLENSKRCIKTS